MCLDSNQDTQFQFSAPDPPHSSPGERVGAAAAAGTVGTAATAGTAAPTGVCADQSLASVADQSDVVPPPYDWIGTELTLIASLAQSLTSAGKGCSATLAPVQGSCDGASSFTWSRSLAACSSFSAYKKVNQHNQQAL